jgi:hypothetical protein
MASLEKIRPYKKEQEKLGLTFVGRSINCLHVIALSCNFESLFTSLVFLPLKNVEIYGDLVFTQYSQISSNTLPQK